MRQSRACAHHRLWATTSWQSITTAYQRMLMGPTLAHPAPPPITPGRGVSCAPVLAGRLAVRRRAGRDGLERDGAEGEFAQRGALGAAVAAVAAVARGAGGGAPGPVPARGRLDGQDGQLTARQIMLTRPATQRLDDVGHVVGAGERLPVGLLRLRSLQLNLEAGGMATAGIGVTGSRRPVGLRGNHEPSRSPEAPPRSGVLRAVMIGRTSLRLPGV